MEAEAVSALRADVTLVPLPFLGYGGTAAVLAARTPEIAPLLDELARTGVLAADRLVALAATRPVFVELDPLQVGSLAAVLEGRTVIAIAHRLFSAHDADRVAVVEDGIIAEFGSHDDLVAAGGSYAALWESWHGKG